MKKLTKINSKLVLLCSSFEFTPNTIASIIVILSGYHFTKPGGLVT